MRDILHYAALGLLIMLITVTPFVVNYADMPWGFERPKAMFGLFLVLVSCGLLIGLRLPKLDKLNWWLVALVIWLILTTIFAFDPQIAVWGNMYRLQGLMFYLSLLVFYILASRIFTFGSVWLIIFSYLLSGVVQAAIGISQAINLYLYSPTQLAKGLYVNGTFGQSEFYAGRLLVTIGIAMVAILKFRHRSRMLQVIVRSLAAAVLVAALVALILTYSAGAYAALSLLLALLVMPKLHKLLRKVFNYRSKAITYAKYFFYLFQFIVAGVFAVILISGDYRSVIWNESVRAFLARPVLGYGLDNQLNALNGITDIIVDRAHNFLLDILLCIGVFGFVLLVAFFWPALKQLWQQIWGKNTVQRLLAVLILTVLLRFIVNTTSAVNVVDLVIIAAVWNYLNTWSEDTFETRLIGALRTVYVPGRSVL